MFEWFIVIIDEQVEIEFVHFIWLWEGQGFADESADSLPECVVPSFDVTSLTGFLSNGLMFSGLDDCWIGFPKITEGSAPAIFFGDQFPELSAGFRTAVADEKRNDLAGPTTQGYPNPSFVGFWIHKRPQFVQFEHVSLLCRKKRRHDVGERLGFFLSSWGRSGGWCRSLGTSLGTRGVLGQAEQRFP